MPIMPTELTAEDVMKLCSETVSALDNRQLKNKKFRRKIKKKNTIAENSEPTAAPGPGIWDVLHECPHEAYWGPNPFSQQSHGEKIHSGQKYGHCYPCEDLVKNCEKCLRHLPEPDVTVPSITNSDVGLLLNSASDIFEESNLGHESVRERQDSYRDEILQTPFVARLRRKIIENENKAVIVKENINWRSIPTITILDVGEHLNSASDVLIENIFGDEAVREGQDTSKSRDDLLEIPLVERLHRKRGLDEKKIVIGKEDINLSPVPRITNSDVRVPLDSASDISEENELGHESVRERQDTFREEILKMPLVETLPRTISVDENIVVSEEEEEMNLRSWQINKCMTSTKKKEKRIRFSSDFTQEEIPSPIKKKVTEYETEANKENTEKEDLVSSLSEKYKSMELPKVGFPNPIATNSCWMNASLQVILRMRYLVADIIKGCRNSENQVLNTFINLVINFVHGSDNYLHKSLRNFKYSLKELNCQFHSPSQQDASEFFDRFFSFILNSPETEAVSYNTKQSIIDDIQYEVEICETCSKCKCVLETRCESSSIFYVNVRSECDVSVQSAVDNEMISDFTQKSCKYCSGKVRMVSYIIKLPKYLLILLNRPHYSAELNIERKEVKLTKKLDLKRWRKSSFSDSKEREEDKRRADGIYQLTGIISHLGSTVREGHFVADVFDPVLGTWTHFDDLKVKEKSVVSDASGNSYLLVYTKRIYVKSPFLCN